MRCKFKLNKLAKIFLKNYFRIVIKYEFLEYVKYLCRLLGTLAIQGVETFLFSACTTNESVKRIELGAKASKINWSAYF